MSANNTPCAIGIHLASQVDRRVDWWEIGDQCRLLRQSTLHQAPWESNISWSSKHIGIQYHFLGGRVQKETVVPEYVPLDSQVENILTKHLARGSLSYWGRGLAWWRIPSSQSEGLLILPSCSKGILIQQQWRISSNHSDLLMPCVGLIATVAWAQHQFSSHHWCVAYASCMQL